MWEEKLSCGWVESRDEDPIPDGRIEGRDEDPIPDGGKPEGRGIPSSHLTHRILVREGMMQNYNQEDRRIINL